MFKNEDALVVFSGGQDSTTCLFWAQQHFRRVHTLSFDYGQRHSLELEMARSLAEAHGFSHQVMDMALLNQLAPNALTRTDTAVETEAVAGALPNTFVEGRNLLFLTFAAIHAKVNGIRHIVTGVSQSDFSGYPDCRDVFIKSANVTLNLAMDHEFVLHTPLMWLDKADTWKLAADLGVLDIIRNRTLTCYNGIPGAGCGQCPACTLRNRGYDVYLERYRATSENG